jgi:hypothetical protein
MEAAVLNQDQEGIDLVKYGVLWQKVQEMDKKVDKMERQLEQLLELANKGKGGLWFGMSIISGISAFVGYLLSYFKH